MKTYTVGDLKTHFSEILDMVQEGEEIAIAYGKKKKVIARIVPEKKNKKLKKRKLGLLKGKATVTFHGPWRMADEEFLKS